MSEISMFNAYPEEGRSGNLFQILVPKRRRWENTCLDQKGLDIVRKNIFKKPYRPIMLDHYWMGRLGFEETGEYYELPDIRIWKFGNRFSYLPESLRLLWVHQLQNLYQDLHGKELPLPPGIVEGNFYSGGRDKLLREPQ